MTAKARTGHIKVVDKHGKQHWLVLTTEVIDVTFPSGSTGATAGATRHLLYGRKVSDLGNDLFDVDGVIYKRVQSENGPRLSGKAARAADGL